MAQTWIKISISAIFYNTYCGYSDTMQVSGFRYVTTPDVRKCCAVAGMSTYTNFAMSPERRRQITQLIAFQLYLYQSEQLQNTMTIDTRDKAVELIWSKRACTDHLFKVWLCLRFWRALTTTASTAVIPATPARQLRTTHR